MWMKGGKGWRNRRLPCYDGEYCERVYLWISGIQSVVLTGYAPRWMAVALCYPQEKSRWRSSCTESCVSPPPFPAAPSVNPNRHKPSPTSLDTHLKGARNHAEKSEKNLIYARHSSKVVLLCVHRLPRIVAIPPCTKKRTVSIPREGTNRKNQGDKV